MRMDGECFHINNDERIPFWNFQRAVAASVGLPIGKGEVKGSELSRCGSLAFSLP